MSAASGASRPSLTPEQREEILFEFLRDTLEDLAWAMGVATATADGPKNNGNLVDDLHLWLASVRCRHCGSVGGVLNEDHTCSCPKHDNDCTAHPWPNRRTLPPWLRYEPDPSGNAPSEPTA